MDDRGLGESRFGLISEGRYIGNSVHESKYVLGHVYGMEARVHLND